RIKETSVLMIVAVALMLVQCGCESKEMARTGFLTDYSRLRAESDTSLRYINKTALGAYSGFIVDKVKVHFFTGASAIEAKSEGKITEQELNDLANYFHSAIVKAVSDSGRKVVHQAGPGVARIRVALTDIKETGALNVLPQASLLGADVGGAAMEAEVVDSMTGKQIGAVVESKKGSQVPFSNLGDWGTAKGVMDDWAKRLQKNLQ
ncbi:MAG: DUF3313 domain-containing protein, partial [Planctomycetota bacterium]